MAQVAKTMNRRNMVLRGGIVAAAAPVLGLATAQTAFAQSATPAAVAGTEHDEAVAAHDQTKNLLATMGQHITEDTRELFNQVQSKFLAAEEKLKGAAQQPLDVARRAYREVQHVMHEIGDHVDSALHKVGHAVGHVWHDVRNAVRNVHNKIDHVLDRIFG